MYKYYYLLKLTVSVLLWMLGLFVMVLLGTDFGVFWIMVGTPIWMFSSGYGAVQTYKEDFSCKCDEVVVE